MDIKNNVGWEPINDNLTTGYDIAIQPTATTSKVLVNVSVHIQGQPQQHQELQLGFRKM